MQHKQDLQNSGNKKKRRRLPRLAGVVAAGALLLLSCAVLHEVAILPPEIPGAEFVGTETCSTCHEETVKDFSRNPHSRIALHGVERHGEFGCEACHGPGSKHVDDGEGNFIVNPTTSPDTCYRCHFDKKAEFNLPFHHPVPEGEMTCTDCHDPHGSDIRKPSSLAMARKNDACAKCHSDITRPHVFEHEALREGCTDCHNVHGSINRKMLVQNDVNLCLKCHTQKQTADGNVYIGDRNHSNYLPRGACWTAGCHTAPHGSNVDSHLRY